MLGTMTVLVLGTGTIGEPLVGLLSHFRDQIDMEHMFVYKRTALLTDRSEMLDLTRRGARLAAADYLQVVSCNTHNLSPLNSSLDIGDEGPDYLVEGRFGYIRRANDMNKEEKFSSRPVVGSPGDWRRVPFFDQRQHVAECV